MQQNPYDVPVLEPTPEPPQSTATTAGFGIRVVAYMIDVLPITIVVTVIYVLFMGMGATFQSYAAEPQNIETRLAFLRQRNQVRDLSFLLYIIYCTLMESSSLQATLGKKLLGIRVTDLYGQQLTISRALGRNLSKLISGLPCGIGFLWAIWSPRHQAWHDSIAKTLTVRDSK